MLEPIRVSVTTSDESEDVSVPTKPVIVITARPTAVNEDFRIIVILLVLFVPLVF